MTQIMYRGAAVHLPQQPIKRTIVGQPTYWGTPVQPYSCTRRGWIDLDYLYRGVHRYLSTSFCRPAV